MFTNALDPIWNLQALVKGDSNYSYSRKLPWRDLLLVSHPPSPSLYLPFLSSQILFLSSPSSFLSSPLLVSSFTQTNFCSAAFSIRVQSLGIFFLQCFAFLCRFSLGKLQLELQTIEALVLILVVLPPLLQLV